MATPRAITLPPPPATMLGRGLVTPLAAVPSPSCANRCEPQHRALPSASTAQLCSVPAATATALASGLTVTGFSRPVPVPSPSWPELFEPPAAREPARRHRAGVQRAGGHAHRIGEGR